jgi:hypothetical protein
LVKDAIASLFLNPPLNGWKRIQANRFGVTEIYLGQRVWSSVPSSGVLGVAGTIAARHEFQSFVRECSRRGFLTTAVAGALGFLAYQRGWLTPRKVLAAELASDSFTTDTSDKNLTVYSTNWTHHAGTEFLVLFTPDSVRTNGTGVDPMASYNAVTFPNDQYAQVIWNGNGNVNAMGAGVRLKTDGTHNGYGMAYYSAATSWLFKYVAGSLTTLGSLTAGTFATNDLFYLEASGSTVKCYRNAPGTDELSATDTAHAAGRGGLATFSGADPTNTRQMDNWAAGSLGAAPRNLTLLGVGP